MSPGASIDGQTLVYGLLGQPLASSLSPAMHNAAFRALQINAAYLPFPVPPARLAEAVKGLAAAGVAGFNLTLPHKLAVLPLLDEITPQAQAVGAVNTVRLREGKLAGTNTDGEGFLLSLAAELDWKPPGKRVLLLGAGGAARGIAFSLLDGGAKTLLIANRTQSRAEALAADCRAAFPDSAVETPHWERLGGLAPDLAVNGTTVGMGDGASPLAAGALEALEVGEGVVDIVYSPLRTPLLGQAQALGLPVANGLGMLLYQGWLAFSFWTGREAPLGVMREALEKGLAARPSG